MRLSFYLNALMLLGIASAAPGTQNDANDIVARDPSATAKKSEPTGHNFLHFG
ncbi:hypothetical protein HIM_05185 [Hirsutella minnesotensis 3608]|uniref:Uncharacterized protein n=1 Tax=Hirsutella minnesotensis 3608 TaxID=1043627 RepID=A0A0F8A5K5_9HYPO|nr:hypothetical protein HIM_05185 [Hirsutella minnesotensis 3608]